MTSNSNDQRWMRAALLQARYAMGQTAPNPAVGCVIVRDDVLVGRGRTALGGRPHAETQAITDAGEKTRGATAYVTLEPCAHHGKTPPCAQALIDAGISRVVIGILDPDCRVAGQGVSMLKDAGISVITDVLAAPCQDVLAGYLKTRMANRPMVTVKIATSLDGRIALANGKSKWITGAKSREYVHLLRSQHDAILTGMGTVKADNPSLNCRLEGYVGRQPLRVIAASKDNLDPSAELAQPIHEQCGGAVLLYLGCDEKGLEHHAERIVVEPDQQGYPDPTIILNDLANRGVTSVMVEAGGRLVASLIKAHLVDRLVMFRASNLIGGDGLPSFSNLGLEELDQGRIFSRISVLNFEDDVVEIFDHK